MAANTQDLWGQLDVELASGERLPVDILREQAQLLGEKTRSVVRGRVSSSIEQDSVRLSFYLEVPALDDYRYLLFEVSHRLKQSYPVYTGVVHERPEQSPYADNEAEFVDWLGQRLSSPETHRTIRGLMAHTEPAVRW